MFAPAVVFGTNDEVTHYRKLAESEGEEVVTQAKFVPGGFCFFFQVALGRLGTGFVHAVCMRGDD